MQYDAPCFAGKLVASSRSALDARLLFPYKAAKAEFLLLTSGLSFQNNIRSSRVVDFFQINDSGIRVFRYVTVNKKSTYN